MRRRIENGRRDQFRKRLKVATAYLTTTVEKSRHMNSMHGDDLLGYESPRCLCGYLQNCPQHGQMKTSVIITDTKQEQELVY